MMDYSTFKQWMSQFFIEKSNELEYSERMSPRRATKFTFDLSTAQTIPLLKNVPCSSIVASRFYSSSTGQDVAGSIKVLFDDANISNIADAISLYPNDTLELDSQARAVLFLWEAQAGVLVDIYVYTDIAARPGTTKTQIVGTISNAPTRYPVPSSVQVIRVTATAGPNTNSYTVPAGKLARITVTCSTLAGFYAGAKLGIGTTNFFCIASANASAVSCTIFLREGQSIELEAGSGASVDTSANAFIEEYDV